MPDSPAPSRYAVLLLGLSGRYGMIYPGRHFATLVSGGPWWWPASYWLLPLLGGIAASFSHVTKRTLRSTVAEIRVKKDTVRYPQGYVANEGKHTEDAR